MKTGDKVFVVNGYDHNSGIHVEGEVIPTIDPRDSQDGMYVSVKTPNYGVQPYTSAFVILDTPANRERYEKFIEEMKAWRKQEPNVYQLRHSFDR